MRKAPKTGRLSLNSPGESDAFPQESSLWTKRVGRRMDKLVCAHRRTNTDMSRDTACGRSRAWRVFGPRESSADLLRQLALIVTIHPTTGRMAASGGLGFDGIHYAEVLVRGLDVTPSPNIRMRPLIIAITIWQRVAGVLNRRVAPRLGSAWMRPTSRSGCPSASPGCTATRSRRSSSGSGASRRSPCWPSRSG